MSVEKVNLRMRKISDILRARKDGHVEAVSPDDNEALKELPKRGSSQDLPGAVTLDMELKRCHLNAFDCWIKNPTTIRIVTGFAFDPRFGWIRHSWITDQSGKLIETCPKLFDEYFGYEISSDDDHAEVSAFYRQHT